jgi:hypothetical protein
VGIGEVVTGRRVIELVLVGERKSYAVVADGREKGVVARFLIAIVVGQGVGDLSRPDQYRLCLHLLWLLQVREVLEPMEVSKPWEEGRSSILGACCG